MRADDLFLGRCRQLASLVVSSNEIDLLDLSGILRQLIMDKKSLAETVNTGKIPLQFLVGEWDSVCNAVPTIKPEEIILETMGDGLDGSDPDHGWKRITVTKSQFLQHWVARSHGVPVTVKDIIGWAANAAGGRHHDPIPKQDYRVIDAISAQVQIATLPFGVYQLRAIGRVTLRALDPLIQDVLQRP